MWSVGQGFGASCSKPVAHWLHWIIAWKLQFQLREPQKKNISIMNCCQLSHTSPNMFCSLYVLYNKYMMNFITLPSTKTSSRLKVCNSIKNQKVHNLIQGYKRWYRDAHYRNLSRQRQNRRIEGSGWLLVVRTWNFKTEIIEAMNLCSQWLSFRYLRCVLTGSGWSCWPLLKTWWFLTAPSCSDHL